jgi:phosphate transport system permease protein
MTAMTSRTAPAPDAPAAPVPRTRRVTSSMTGRDGADLAGAAVTALSLTVLLFGHLAALSGGLGFVATTYVLFVASYAVLASMGRGRTAVADKVATVVLYSLALLLLAALVLIIFYTLVRGRAAVLHLNFLSQDMSQAGPLSPLTMGGVAHALLGTLWMISIALLITVPLGLTCAVYLSQVGGRGSGLVRTVVEAMTALPSIVAGLFIFATWVLILGFERSGLAAALAIATMMLPIIIRAADVVLRVVPGNLKEASEALGAPRWRTVAHVVLPTARSGLTTSVILGTARGIGETSPVLLTAGYTVYLNVNPVHGPMVSLPLAVFELVRSPQPAFIERGFATAALLMVVVVGLFVLARMAGGRGPGQVTPRQARRIAHRSARDVLRYEDRGDPVQPGYLAHADHPPHDGYPPDGGGETDLLPGGPWTSPERSP